MRDTNHIVRKNNYFFQDFLAENCINKESYNYTFSNCPIILRKYFFQFQSYRKANLKTLLLNVIMILTNKKMSL